ncbi:hypothetical protein PoB_000133000 [Plakobranchus ocellatus]|uniref:Uncharacterized protein n=1 Tax=Plakobranchus ocellatus TaxID=259542 RepID=A0AAV3XVI6_9GAST|nr:hypothetical protein PoB_000133000 [Plakobranchus ocellatus]
MILPSQVFVNKTILDDSGLGRASVIEEATKWIIFSFRYDSATPSKYQNHCQKPTVIQIIFQSCVNKNGCEEIKFVAEHWRDPARSSVWLHKLCQSGTLAKGNCRSLEVSVDLASATASSEVAICLQQIYGCLDGTDRDFFPSLTKEKLRLG